MQITLNDTWPATVDKTTPVEELSQIAGFSTDEFLRINPHIEDLPEVPPDVPLNIPVDQYQPFIEMFNQRLNKLRLSKQPPVMWAIEEWKKGIHEYRGPNASNPEIEKYHATTGGVAPDDVPWCSSFVNWCVEQAGQTGTGNRAARSWNRWGDTTDSPVRGDIAVFERKGLKWNGHVGFYWKDSEENVKILGGNQTNAVRVQAYPKNGRAYKLLSYRRVSVFEH